jgi:hypothetical protein
VKIDILPAVAIAVLHAAASSANEPCDIANHSSRRSCAVGIILVVVEIGTVSVIIAAALSIILRVTMDSFLLKDLSEDRIKKSRAYVINTSKLAVKLANSFSRSSVVGDGIICMMMATKPSEGSLACVPVVLYTAAKAANEPCDIANNLWKKSCAIRTILRKVGVRTMGSFSLKD